MRTISPGDREWPRALSEIADPPQRLFVAGRPLTPDAACVALVGTRYPTVAGTEIARELSGAIAQAGYVVVSGLAVGIDAAAHRAALDAGGTTTAVVGAGLDVDYPQRNRALRRDIETGGTVISEYETGTKPQPQNFPARNRIIAGLSVATVVIEGGLKSGALITARLALEANRAVFAVPGSIRNAMAEGPNHLIKSCAATPLTDPADLFAELAATTAWERKPDAPSTGLQPEELVVLTRLDDVAALPGTIASDIDLAAGRVGLVLSRLEVQGLVARAGAGYRITETGARRRAAELLHDERMR